MHRTGPVRPALSASRSSHGSPGRRVDSPLLVPAGGAEAAAGVVAQRLGGDRFTVVERTVGSAPGPYSKKVRALSGEVWLVRPDGHLAWRGAPDSPGLGRWLDGALHRGHA